MTSVRRSPLAPGQGSELTGDRGRGFEGLGYLGVHVDHAVLLRGHALVADVIGLHHPLAEGLAYDGVGDVADELARQPAPVLLLRQVVENLGVLLDLLEDLVDGEGLVHRHVDVAHPVALDVLPTEKAGLVMKRGPEYRLPSRMALRK